MGLGVAALLVAVILPFIGPDRETPPPRNGANESPYGLSPPKPVELHLDEKSKAEHVTVQQYIPPYDVIGPLWRTPEDRRFDTPENAHFSALSSRTKEQLLECMTKETQGILLAADARKKGKLLRPPPENAPWPPDPFTRYLYKVQFRRGGRIYALIKVRIVFKRKMPVQVPGSAKCDFVLAFVKTPRGWLRTFELGRDPVLQLINSSTYAQLVPTQDVGQ